MCGTSNVYVWNERVMDVENGNGEMASEEGDENEGDWANELSHKVDSKEIRIEMSSLSFEDHL